MRDIMLIIHFIGLVMGLGTSFAFMFLGIASSKMEKDEARKFSLNTFSLSKMGYIGLALLIISGLFLMAPYWNNLSAMPYLIAKLILVLLLVIMIGIIGVIVSRAKKGDEKHLKKTETIGKLSLLTGIAIVVLAVLIFG